MKLTKIVYIIIFLGIIFVVFKNWFLTPEVIGGDWQYLFNEMLKEFYFFPLSWDPGNGNGLGGINPLYSLIIYNNFTIFIASYFHVPWVIVYKIFWFGFFIALSIFSSIVLLKSVITNVKYWQACIGGLIFTLNSYILMIVGGGQMGVALAYSIAPLVLAIFIKLIASVSSSKNSFSYALVAGLVLGIQIMFDSRISYITLLIIGLFCIYHIAYYKFEKISIHTALYVILTVVILPISIAILLHASWILPLLLFRQNPIGGLGQSFVGNGIVRFLSFAHFSDAIALLHPNWPENLFGKVYFMRPEFLFLPILAFSSLLFTKKTNRIIIFFVLLALVGPFIAKGANPPFGDIYLWMFAHIPGFVLFRDPTKFYLLVSLSYLVLIPFSMYAVSEWIESKIKDQKFKKQISYIFLLFVTGYLLFLIRPALLGQLGGTFKRNEIPKEYIALKDFLYKQPEFFRTLWIPKGSRFNFYSNKHLIIVPELLFGTQDITIISKKLHTPETMSYLQELGVKYIIVPFDPLGEIFVQDRKYDGKQYMNTIKQLETVPWLKKLSGFGKIVVFEVQNPKDRFWLSGNGKISYTMINPVDYNLSIEAVEPQTLIFSENYNPSWVGTSDNITFVSKKTASGLNSFVLSKSGIYDMKITFIQQKYYKYGQIISLITLISVVLGIIVFQKKKV